MPTNPFEDILIKMAEEIVDIGPNMTEDQVLFILRSNLNPFPPQVQDKFQSQFSVKNLLNPKI
jgi:hypothetical protein